MSNNVGDVKSFTLSGTKTDGFRYVWKWWDGSVDCTQVNTIDKTLNLGGNPSDGYQVRYTVEVVDDHGHSAQYAGALPVNNPPSIVLGSARVSDNGKLVAYTTKASVQVYDLENQDLAFSWRVGQAVHLGSGDTVNLGMIPGTYAGTYVGLFAGTEASINYSVTQNAVLTLTVTDSEDGSTDINFPLYGYTRTDPYVSSAVTPSSQSSDASAQPVVTDGENATFALYTAAGAPRTVFVWGFWGTNGWTIPSSSNGSTQVLPDGSIRNVVIKATTGEAPGEKLAEVTAIDLDHNTVTVLTVPVQVISNDPPSVLQVTNIPSSPIASETIRLSVDATDPNNDLLEIQWTFSSPASTLWGRTVYVDTTGMLTGQVVAGFVTATDRLGATAQRSFSIPLG